MCERQRNQRDKINGQERERGENTQCYVTTQTHGTGPHGIGQAGNKSGLGEGARVSKHMIELDQDWINWRKKHG